MAAESEKRIKEIEAELKAIQQEKVCSQSYSPLFPFGRSRDSITLDENRNLRSNANDHAVSSVVSGQSGHPSDLHPNINACINLRPVLNKDS